MFSSLSGAALGLAWAWTVLFGLWQLWAQRHSNLRVSPPLFIWVWLLASAVALSLKMAMTLHWGEPWQDRHGEIRMLLSATAAWGLYGYLQPSPRQRVLWIQWISHALSLFALTGLLVVLWFNRTGLTTHPIPWAGVMAIVSCWLLAVGLDDEHSGLCRNIWLAGGLLAVLAVLASQSRGVFVVVAWWLAILGYRAWQHLRAHPQSVPTPRKLLTTATAVCVSLIALAQTPVLERPIAALRDAFFEVQLSSRSAEAAANSSVGARLYMWQRGVDAIAQAPWLGHGVKGTRRLLLEWAEDAQSHELARLAHLHNEYLNQLVEHGALGLSSQLLYLLALLVMVRSLKKAQQPSAAAALAGILVVHAFGSISNVNFAHNYYTTGLSLMMALTIGLLGSRPQTGPERL